MDVRHPRGSLRIQAQQGAAGTDGTGCITGGATEELQAGGQKPSRGGEMRHLAGVSRQGLCCSNPAKNTSVCSSYDFFEALKTAKKSLLNLSSSSSLYRNYNSLIQTQARELSHLRQRIREGQGVCHILTQNLGDTTKVQQAVLQQSCHPENCSYVPSRNT